MSRLLRLAAVSALWVLVAVAAAGCGSDERFLPPGTFAGSTPTDRPFKIVVGDKPLIDGEPAEWIGRGSMRERKNNKENKDGERSRVDCVVQAEGEELRCTWSLLGRPDVPPAEIELLRQ